RLPEPRRLRDAWQNHGDPCRLRRLPGPRHVDPQARRDSQAREMSNNDTRLQQIQALQFTDRAAAEGLLLAFVRETFPALDTVGVELRPLAVSLNSFNGFLTLADKSKLFFKTHVEPGSVIDEYYNSMLLVQSGYPVILPRYASTEYGK